MIAGPPNAGKSRLLNALAKRDAAIVSEEAGTTRDVIEVHLDLGGVPVMLIDTAGLREARGAVEAEGIRAGIGAGRGRRSGVVAGRCHRAAMGRRRRASAGKSRANSAKPALIAVLNKIDLAPDAGAGRDALEFSAKTGDGIGSLVAALAEQRGACRRDRGRGAALTRARHRAELTAAEAALERFGDPSLSPELKAEELRLAARHLGRLTGRIDVEEVLGAIFAEFCIGK